MKHTKGNQFKIIYTETRKGASDTDEKTKGTKGLSKDLIIDYFDIHKVIQ